MVQDTAESTAPQLTAGEFPPEANAGVLPEFNTHVVLASPSVLSPWLLRGRTLGLEVNLGDNVPTIEIVAQFEQNGEIRYKFKDPGNHVNLPENISLSNVSWVAINEALPDPDSACPMDDIQVAGALNNWFGLIGGVAKHTKQTDLSRAIAYADSFLVANDPKAKTPASHTTYPITTRLASILELVDAHSLTTTNWAEPFDPSKQQITVNCISGPQTIVVDPANFFIDPKDRTGDPIALREPVGFVEALNHATVHPRVVINPDGVTIEATVHQTPQFGRIYRILNSTGPGVGGVFGDQTALTAQGYQFVAPTMADKEFLPVATKLIESETSTAQTRMAITLAHIRQQPEDEVVRAIAKLPKTNPMSITGQPEKIMIAGQAEFMETDKSGLPTGRVNNMIRIDLNGQPYWLTENNGQIINLAGGFTSLTDYINFQALLIDGDINPTEHPLLGVVATNLPLNTSNTEGLITAQPIEIIVIDRFPIFTSVDELLAGTTTTSIILPDSGFTCVQMTGDTDWKVDIQQQPDGSFNYTYIQELLPIEREIKSAVKDGHILSSRFRGLTQAQILELQNAMKFTVGAGGLVGMTTPDFKAFAHKYQLYKEKSECSAEVNNFIKALAQFAISGQRLNAKTIGQLQSKYKNAMKIFGATTALPQSNQGVIRLAKVEQEEFGHRVNNRMYRMVLYIESDLTEFDDLYMVSQDEKIEFFTNQSLTTKPANQIITTINALKLLAGNRYLEHTEIQHTHVIPRSANETKINNITLQTDDVIASQFDEAANISGEIILRRTRTANQIVYSKVESDSEVKPLDRFHPKDIKLELLYRLLHGEIARALIPGTTDQYTITEIPIAQRLPLDKIPPLGHDELLNVSIQLEELAKQEAMNRIATRAAELLCNKFEITDLNQRQELLNRLVAKWQDLQTNGYTAPEESADIKTIKFDFENWSGEVNLDLEFFDIISREKHARQININVKSNTLGFSWDEEETEPTRIFGIPVGETTQLVRRQADQLSPFLNTLTKTLITSTDMVLDKTALTNAYIEHHNQTDNIWLHGVEGQVAWRLHNQRIKLTNGSIQITDSIVIIDPTNPRKILFFANPNNYTFDADKDTTGAVVEEARYVQRRFFPGILTPLEGQKLNMLFEFAAKQEKIEKIIDLYKKETEVIRLLEPIKKTSKLCYIKLPNGKEIDLLSESGDNEYYANADKRDFNLSLLTVLAFSPLKEIEILMQKELPVNEFMNGSYGIQGNINRTQEKRAGGNLIITDVTLSPRYDGESAITGVIIGGAPNARFDGLKKNIRPEKGIVYLLDYVPDKGPQLLLAKGVYKLEGNVYEPTVDPYAEYIDPFAEDLYRNNLIENLRALLEGDPVWKMLLQAENEWNWEEYIILFELLRINTDNITKDRFPKITDVMFANIIKPFEPKGRTKTEDVGSVTIDRPS